MSDKPYLLFDAGGTLIFPDQALLIQQAQQHDIQLTHDQLFIAYYQLIHELDQHTRQHGQLPPIWPQGYPAAVLHKLGVADPARSAIIEACRNRDRHRSLWSFTLDWIPQALAHLAEQGYRMSVISNSDGRVATMLTELGLAVYFEQIFDSALVGVEKPEPAIFDDALGKLGLSAADAFYIGDVFYIDVLGANRAGLAALHLDPLELYAAWPGVHLPDIRHLTDWLAGYQARPAQFDLFPMKGSDGQQPARGPA